MANPRRATTTVGDPFPSPSSSARSAFASIQRFLKRPLAFPLLLSAFLLLTWISLRLQQPTHLLPSSSLHDLSATSGSGGPNFARFSSVEFPSTIFRDERGWLLNPLVAAKEAGVSGGAQSCVSVHVGEIRPGGVRGNHRHNTCNETFIIWGAETKFRLENQSAHDIGYSETRIGVNDVAIAASPSGTAHALINVDTLRVTFFLGCQDCVPSYNTSATDYKIWNDL